MYSGSTLTKLSGRLLGAHQKIDRVARQNLQELMPAAYSFPSIRSILHFEGRKGPDAIKRKSPSKDEPWHFIKPFDDSDDSLLRLIKSHYKELIKALCEDDEVRAAFEAAWLAHAIVDGLTPAHHHAYEEKLVELRGGEGIESRTTLSKRIVMPGSSRVHKIKNNWGMWGAKGLFTTHAAFELGVATIIAPASLKKSYPSKEELEEYSSIGMEEWFSRTAKEIAAMGLYDKFYKIGWTPRLARQVRRQLAPSIVKAVTLIWYGAAREASKQKSEQK